MSRPDEKLLAYLRGELSGTEEESLEEHVFGCETCAERVEALLALDQAIADLCREGRVTVSGSLALLEQAFAEGVPLRSYRLEPGGSVQCRIDPGERLVAIRLSADLTGAEELALDVRILHGELEAQHVTIDGLLADRTSGEIVLLYAGDLIRSLPQSTIHYRLLAREGQTERPLGEYTLYHSPSP